MNQRAQYLIQILEKIASPLMSAIIQSSPPGGENDAKLADDAKKMAELLSKTVQTSIEMGKNMDFSGVENDGDALRLALTGVASALIADEHRQGGKIPGDADIKRLTTALQAAITFSENFTPDEQNAARLQNIKAQGQPVDQHQAGVQYIQALVPVVNAVSVFPFGQPPQKLIVDVTNRLIQMASTMGKSFFGDIQDQNERKTLELALLNTLAAIYCGVHQAETARLMAMNDDQRAQQPQAPGGGLSMDNVWKSFEERAAMLEELAKNILPGGATSAGAGTQSPAPPPAQEQQQAPAAPPAQPQPQTEQTATPPPAEQPPQQQPAQQAPAQSGNPMAMFAKKPAQPQDSAPPATPAPTTPQEPPAAPPVQQPPPQTEQQTPPPQQPPAQPPAQQPPAPPPSDEGQAQDGSPMSFFKKPKDDDEA